jgi:hypothetical protein
MITEALLREYQKAVDDLGDNPSGEQIVKMLEDELDWTPEASVELLRLAKEYGMFMLQSAFSLAWALEIEDGSKGF